MNETDRPGTGRDSELPPSDRIAVGMQSSCCDAGAALLCVGDDEVAREVAAAGFAALWNGSAGQPSKLVASAPDDADAVAAVLADRGRAEVDDDGLLVGIHGLTLRVTRHRIVHDGRIHWT